MDILVVEHPNSAVAKGWQAIAQLNINTILLNSGIVNKQVRVRRINMPASITSFVLSPNAFVDANNVKDNTQFQALRNSYGADVVVLLSSTTWINPTTGGTVFGSASGAVTNSENAYCVVSAPFSFAGRYTLAHEIAHTWGARHARVASGGDDDGFDCAHAHVFAGLSGPMQRTILGPLAIGSRIPYFSNPSVLFDGVATGVADAGTASTTAADNSRKIKNSTCDVQNYKQPLTLYAQINGPAAMCSMANINYQAWVTNGTNQNHTPATYVWSVSPSPTGPFTTLATNGANNAWVSATLGVPGSTFFLNLTITTNAGTTFTTSKAILVFSTCFDGGGIDDRDMEATSIQYDPNLYIAPNPAQGIVRFGTKEVAKTIHNVSIYSSNGVLVLSSSAIPADTKEITLDVSQIATGLYYAKFFTNQGVQTKLLNIITN